MACEDAWEMQECRGVLASYGVYGLVWLCPLWEAVPPRQHAHAGR